MSDHTDIRLPPSATTNAAVKKFLDFKTRKLYEDLPDAPYKTPPTILMLQVVNKFFLFLGLFACLWFALMFSYLYFHIYVFIVFLTIFLALLLTLAYLSITNVIGFDSFLILLGIMLFSASYWFVQINF